MVKTEEQRQEMVTKAVYWLSEGYNTAEIGYELNCSTVSAMNLLEEAMDMYGAKDKDDLIAKALLIGLIEKNFGFKR